RDAGQRFGSRTHPASAAPVMAEMSRTPSAPACIVYTSGSTGGPKGVLLTHCLLLHRSDLQVLTAASFLTDPADGMRFFRTGDLGRWRKDGTLEHCGRKGRNIKLRGFSVASIPHRRSGFAPDDGKRQDRSQSAVAT